jgi:uncharacterized protein
MKLKSILALLSAASSVFLSAVQAQVSMSALNTPITQNFDSLANTGTPSWADNSTILGWYAARTGATPLAAYTPSAGTSNTGSLYSFGAAGSTDRALGGVGSTTTGNMFWAVRLVNDTGSALTSVDVAYVCEQWRNGGNTTAQKLSFEYQVASPGTITAATTPSSGWIASTTLDCIGPVATAVASALDGNLTANKGTVSATITAAVPIGQEIWLRWADVNDTGNDHGLAIDDFAVTPKGAVVGLPSLAINDVSVTEGNSGTTTTTFTVSLSTPAPIGGVTFDIATADGSATVANDDYVAKRLTAQTIPAGSKSMSFDVTVNGDTTTEPNETFFVNITNVSGATVSLGQGRGTIINDDVSIIPINQIQGTGASSPIIGSSVSTRGIVTATYGGFRGFYIQTPDANIDADPTTSEGIFVFVNSATLPTAAVVGNLVDVTGIVGEFGTSPSTATQLGSVAAVPTVTQISAGNPLPVAINVALPFASATALEPYEGMRVNFSQTLTVSGNFTLGRFGEVVLSSNGRLINPSNAIDLNDDPASGVSIAGNSNLPAITAALAANLLNQVTLDDTTSAQNADPAPFGLSAANTLRAGSTVTGLVGIVNQIAQGYRILADPSNLPNFDRAPRPAAPPAVGGTMKAAGFNVLNYFNGNGTNVDGVAGGFPTPRGANNLPEFNRQRAKIIAAIDQMGADVVGVIEMENDGDTPTSALPNLLSGLAVANGTAQWNSVALPPGWGAISGSTDAITTRLIYKNANVEPVGAPLFCDDVSFVNARTPLAQVFRSRTTGGKVIVSINHFKSKSCGTAAGADADQADGQGCWAPARLAQAQALISCVGQWQTASGENRALLLGDFNAYEQENAIDAFRAAGLVPLINDSYSFVFDGASGSLDHAIASPQLLSQVTGANKWHINADEPISLDYNTEFKTPAQQASLYAADPFRSSDHDPALVGMALIDSSEPACKLDLDGDGKKLALVDGLVALRAMLGVDTASTGAISFPVGATRTDWTAIRDYLSIACLPSNPFCTLDIDGNGTPDATVDGLIILRSLLGLTENAVVGDLVFPPAATRTTWDAIRGYLNGTCGANLPLPVPPQ